MMTIGEASRASGVSAKMIRYYESISLITPPMRSDSGYRLYSQQDVHTLGFIRRCRRLGFSIHDIGHLVRLWRDQTRSSGEVKQIALAHVEDLQRKIDDLEAMRRTLEHLAVNCHGDHRPDCPILDDLAGRETAGRKATEDATANPAAIKRKVSKTTCS